MTVLVKAGTEIHDEYGNLVATVVYDLRKHDYVGSEQFKMADGHTPVEGEQMPKAVFDYLRKFL